MLRLLLLLLFGTCVVAHTAHEKEHAAPRRVVLAKVHAARETARLASGSFFWAVWRFSWKNPISAEGGWTCKYDENIRHHTITLSTSKVVVLLYGIYLCVHVSIFPGEASSARPPNPEGERLQKSVGSGAGGAPPARAHARALRSGSRRVDPKLEVG